MSRNLIIWVITLNLSYLPAAAYSGTTNPPEAYELQWTVCPESSIALWDLLRKKKDSDAKIWETYFLDTDDLKLLQSKSVLRIRKFSDEKFKSSLKKNFTLDEFLTATEEQKLGGNCETDLYQNHKKVGCSLKYRSTSKDSLFSKDQISALLTNYQLGFNQLLHFGPAKTYEVEVNFADDIDFSFEIIFDKSGRLYPELSVRTVEEKINSTISLVEIFLKDNEINLCQTQGPKSQAIIESFKTMP